MKRALENVSDILKLKIQKHKEKTRTLIQKQDFLQSKKSKNHEKQNPTTNWGKVFAT